MTWLNHCKIFLLLSFISALAISGCATQQQADRIESEVKRIEWKLDAMQERPAPVTREEAAAIATRFAGFKTVESVRQRRVVSKHTETFNIMGNDGRGDILVGINPSTGEVIKMVKQCPYPERDSEKIVLSGDESVSNANAFLAKRNLPPIPEGFVMQKPQLFTTWKKKHWRITWNRFIDDVEVATDFVTFFVNAETGDITLYSKVKHDIKVEHLPKLDVEEAVKKARSFLGKGALEPYSSDMKVLKTSLKILYPNHYFKDLIYHWSDRQALAWVVQFSTENVPEVDLWIDAHTGELLGGEIYERPIPELYGIPNQQTDVTHIWEPAFDAMQYNTIHTITADTTEATITGSITAGDYFVLHTHGGATATAEAARISHAGSWDAQHLTPDEIPANNLRYALFSFCESAHDGPGVDFKDSVIDQGADVFMGYVESINPDPYESALVGYLAEGRNLANAHWNAFADTAPWFTILIEYGPPLFCYNQLKLAPLHVHVTAPLLAFRNATITATIRNGENARHSTATNVTAELKLPPGFTILAGGNPQVAPALAWNGTWTPQWTVHAPLWAMGTKTFDVVVHSDNLGVEVDDYAEATAPSPLYHPADIHFLFFHFPIIEYLDLVKWWELAKPRFAEYPEPGKILSISKDLAHYKSADDVQKDPGPFLRNMVAISELESAFGRHFMQEGAKTSPDIQRYLEAVDTKRAYLEKLQDAGIGDAKEAITDFSGMQIEINALATKAFWKR
ncbi:MAG: PepSY domain-containing protein [Deltaproteobacteria bacterium]|nr:PepSY domain-containing protein [Deltaproteobacteria bacterium]